MKLLNVTGQQTNPFYNPNRCNNGGGYWQSQGSAEWEMGDMPNVKLLISDDSCGDFGSRFSCRVTIGDLIGFANWGTMYEEDEEDTEIFDIVEKQYPIDMWRLFWDTLKLINEQAEIGLE